jgi:hypothetical protein
VTELLHCVCDREGVARNRPDVRAQLCLRLATQEDFLCDECREGCSSMEWRPLPEGRTRYTFHGPPIHFRFD